MAIKTKLRVRKSNAKTKVSVLVNHPMTPGDGYDRTTGHYIEDMVFEVNGSLVAQIQMGPGVSENPLTSVYLEGTRTGDRVTVRWIDNRQRVGTAGAELP